MIKRILQKKLEFINRVLKSFSISIDMHKLKKLSNFIFRLVEKIVVKLDKFVPFYLSFYDEMISNEIKLANISSNDSILHIGCGSIPATSIILNQKLGSKITCIDKDLNSIKNAKTLLSKLKILDKINVVFADGRNFSPKDFDVIILSDGINVLDELLNNLSKSVKNQVRIILRLNSLKAGKYICGKSCPNSNKFKVISIVNHTSYGEFTSILLKTN